MRVTQGTFSFLPDFTDDEITAQIRYALDHHWALSVEYTDDPHPRNSYWEMWDLPMFDAADASTVFIEVEHCRAAYPDHYVKVTAYDPSHGRQTTALDLIVNRPTIEPGFTLDRQEASDRQIRYTVRAFAADRPHGGRYPPNGSP